MDMKRKILMESLTLFAQKGYSAVYVGDIAKSVGIKAPSLYKHYKSKQDIFDSCVRVFSERMNEVRNEQRLPGTSNAQFTYDEVSEDQLIQITTSLFLFYLKDDIAAKFRKMLMIERYHNDELNAIYEKLFISDVISYEEQIFHDLVKKRVLKNVDSHILALRFYTPIFYLLQKYDMRPEETKLAIDELSQLIRDFCQVYKEVKIEK